MTDLVDIQIGAVKADNLLLKVTRATAGKFKGQFAIGLFYERKNTLYCYSVPDNNLASGWHKTPTEAIEKWKSNNPSDKREILQENKNE